MCYNVSIMRKIKGLLHDHIDGSQAMLEILPELYKQHNLVCPFTSLEEARIFFKDPQINIVEKFGSVTSVLQTKEALELAGYTYGKFRKSQGLKYVEGKFAPQYHTKHLSLKEATNSMISGLQKAEKEFDITIVPQICIGREASPELGVDIAKIVLDYDGEVVLDLACDEANHPPEKHLKAYQLTFGSKVIRDCHAGEWVNKIPHESTQDYRNRLLKNVKTAVYDLNCHSISHAIPLCDDMELIEYIVTNGIRVVGNPLSNLHCGLINHINELQIPKLLDLGVMYTVSVDDDLLFPSVEGLEQYCTQSGGILDGYWKIMNDNLNRSRVR